MKKYLAEFVGTFFIVLTICMATYSKVSADLQPLAFGTMIMVMVYAIGHISGGQFNPAVSVALFLRGKLVAKDLGFYIVAQFLGGAAAAVTSMYLISGKPPVAPIIAPPQFFVTGQAVLAELLGAFALVWVVLNVATSKSLEGNNFYGLAIGFAYTALEYALGSVSGGAFNPAIALGIAIAQLNTWQTIWIFLLGSFGGGALAALFYRYVVGED
jgi:aquaporin Z